MADPIPTDVLQTLAGAGGEMVRAQFASTGEDPSAMIVDLAREILALREGLRKLAGGAVLGEGRPFMFGPKDRAHPAETELRARQDFARSLLPKEDGDDDS